MSTGNSSDKKTNTNSTGGQRWPPCFKKALVGTKALRDLPVAYRELLFQIQAAHIRRWLPSAGRAVFEVAAERLGLDNAQAEVGQYLGCSEPVWVKHFCDPEDCPLREPPSSLTDVYSRYYFLSLSGGKRHWEFSPRALAQALMARFRFISAGTTLFVFKDGVYAPDGEDIVTAFAQRELLDEYRHAKAQETIKFLAAACRTHPDELAGDPRYLVVENGVLEWKTGRLLPHTSAVRSTVMLPVKYEPAAKSAAVDKYFATTFPAEVARVVEEMIGYLLIPDTRFEKAFLLVGPGRNGKSTLLKAIDSLLGAQNVSKVPLHELGEQRFKRAELYGKLANICADLDDRALASTGIFKAVVSGDPIDAERKFKDPFTFRPYARLVFSCNQLPVTHDLSHAFFRRILPIPFSRTFPEDEVDPDLTAKLTTPESLSALLNRALEGLRRLYRQGGFSVPAPCLQILDDYRLQVDSLRSFIEERATFGPGEKVSKDGFYTVYAEWCREQGLRPLSRHRVNARLQAEWGITELRQRKGPRLWQGVALGGGASPWERERNPVAKA